MMGPQNMEDVRFNRTGWAALLACGLLLAGCLAQSAYRLSLPSDGWVLPYDVSQGEQRYVFAAFSEAWATPLQSGDILVAVEGQAVGGLVQHAIRLSPERPANWAAGQAVRYTVLRASRELTLEVPLNRRSLRGYLAQWWAFTLEFPAAVLQLLAAIFVFWRRPGSQATGLFLVWNIAQLANSISLSVSGQGGGPAELFYPGAYWPASAFNVLIYPLFIVPFLAHFFLVFPVVKGPMRRWPARTLLATYGLPVLLLLPGFALRLDQPLAFWRTPIELGSPLIFPAALLVAGLSLGHTLFTERDAAHRAQARWLAAGLVTSWGIGQGALFFLPALGLIPASPLLTALTTLLGLAFPVSLAVAILRYRLFDIDLILNRTLVYGSLTALLALVYLGSVILLQSVFRSLTGQSQSALVTVVSTLTIAALFAPLRSRLQIWIDRRFYRRKYDAARTLAAFSTAARDETDLDRLAGRLADVVDETMQPDQVSVWLRPRRETEAGARRQDGPG